MYIFIYVAMYSKKTKGEPQHGGSDQQQPSRVKTTDVY